jgi:hypothetical protein
MRRRYVGGVPMPSTWGAKNGYGREYDRFRTGLSFSAVRQMLNTYAQDRGDWKRITRGTVLGRWHQLKLELYEQATATEYILARRSS